MLNPEYGLVNAALRSIGTPGKGWLSDPALAMPCCRLGICRPSGVYPMAATKAPTNAAATIKPNLNAG